MLIKFLEITMSQWYQASSVLHVHVVHLGAHIRTWEEQSTPENVFNHRFRPTHTICLDDLPKDKNKYNFHRSTKISTTKKIHWESTTKNSKQKNLKHLTVKQKIKISPRVSPNFHVCLPIFLNSTWPTTTCAAANSPLANHPWPQELVKGRVSRWLVSLKRKRDVETIKED